jgi:hypothetical protein
MVESEIVQLVKGYICMYCVICGHLLQEQNREGIICCDCKQERKERRKNAEQIIRVHYCFSCGNPYNPNDASIRHEHCGVVLASNTLSLQSM